MTMIKPIWFDYLEWDYSDIMYPKMTGFKEGTPEEIKKQYYEDQKMFEEARKKGINY